MVSMDNILIIETDRLIFRPFTLADAGFLKEEGSEEMICSIMKAAMSSYKESTFKIESR